MFDPAFFFGPSSQGETAVYSPYGSGYAESHIASAVAVLVRSHAVDGLKHGGRAQTAISVTNNHRRSFSPLPGVNGLLAHSGAFKSRLLRFLLPPAQSLA